MIIVLVGILGLSSINEVVFAIMYDTTRDNLLKEFILIRKIKVIAAVIIIWILGIFIGIRTEPEKEIVYYILTIFHCLIWTFILLFSHIGAGLLS